MYKRVLVPRGGSPWAQAVVAYAIALTMRLGAELRILTVLTTRPSCAALNTMEFFDLVLDSSKHEGERRLLQAAACATWAGVTHATVLKWDTNVPRAIL